ncbi:MAG: TipAS antibiotic-recognition domain-containing protein, partial [Clostridia bacterium]|nr:TipAS antibiotic-recognition domain-containing protein [Clostridia bacterium]
MNNYNSEAKGRFGETAAYKEYAEKTANYTNNKWQDVTNGLMKIFNKFTESMNNGNTADSTEAQALVKNLQTYITENYYTCQKEILAGLGQMYVSDERFKNNIDKNSDGTAAFISKA